MTRLTRAWAFLGPNLPVAGIYVFLAFLALRHQGYGLPELHNPDDITSLIGANVSLNRLNPGYFFYSSLTYYGFFIPAWLLKSAGLLDPADLTQVGHVCRTVNALFYLLTAFFSARTLSALFEGLRPWFAHLFVGTLGGLLHHAHLGTVRSSLYCCIALALWLFVRTLRSGRERDFYLAVAACGLCVGAKYNGIFVFGALPVLWLCAFGPRRLLSKFFLRCLGISLLVAPAAFLLTTPYALLDASTFMVSIRHVALEMPEYRCDWPLPFYLDRAWDFALACFSPVTLVSMIFWTGVGAAFVLIPLADRARRLERPAKEALVLKACLVILAAWGSFEAMNFRMTVDQARYFLPGSQMLALLFLIAVERLRRDERFGRRGRLVLGVALVPVILSSVLNCFAHLDLYPRSGHSLADAAMQPVLAASPEARVGFIRFEYRSPIQRAPIRDRIDEFVLRQAVRDEVKTWDDYLAFIAARFRAAPPRYMILEDGVFMWFAFTPGWARNDRYTPTTIPNPGSGAWRRMLAGLGYREIARFTQQKSPLAVFVGDHHLKSSISMQGDVLVFEREPGR